jgi:hypothetical protein
MQMDMNAILIMPSLNAFHVYDCPTMPLTSTVHLPDQAGRSIKRLLFVVPLHATPCHSRHIKII